VAGLAAPAAVEGALMYGTTYTTGNGGCRYCGCTCSTTACGGDLNRIVVVIDPWFDPLRRAMRDLDLDEMLRSFKATSLMKWFPDWLVELQAIPRRMKRHFPRSLPGPAMCFAPLRPGHRNRMRIKRLWRHACSN
jgi:hypothetical protein